MCKQLHGGWLTPSICHFSHCVEYPHVCSVSHPEHRQKIFNLRGVLAWALALINNKQIKLNRGGWRPSKGYS